MNKTSRLLLPVVLLASLPAAAQYAGDGIANKVSVHGSVQADVLFPEDDYDIGTEHYSDKILGNFYANASVFSKYVDGGARIEYLQHPLPGFEQAFKGWGLANIFVKGKYRNCELTLGDFYEQFGSGFILRTYEERSLGIDNSIRGARVKVNAVKGLRLTALGGVQRRFWDWDMRTKIAGADAEAALEQYSQALRDRNISWSIGASYVFKHEKDEDIIVPGTNYKLNLPLDVHSFDIRTHFNRNAWDFLGEFAWKGSDPSADNNYTYRTGTAVMLSGSYAKKGFSALVQAKRSENMAFRSKRTQTLTAAFLNNMPAFAYQHTYALAAKYPYATQTANGEWAFQAAFAYNFKRKTAIGGKYGTKVKVNLSYIRGLDKGPTPQGINGSTWGTDGAGSKFFGFGKQYYRDINVQIEKKFTRDFQLAFMYMNQYNFDVTLEDWHGDVKANIFVLDGKYKFDKRFTLRTELQYLTTHQAYKDWAYGLLELSVAPYLMFTVSDQWNCGGNGRHYYLASVAGNYKANRLMLSYGRTPAGFDCSGGVCRFVPKTRGFRIAYTYNF